MEIDSETEKETLRDLARLQLMEFDPSEDESIPLEDKNVDQKPLSKTYPHTREARGHILAEEIIRFASITDRPVTSLTPKTTLHSRATLDSTSDDTQHSGTPRNNGMTMEHLNSWVANRDEAPKAGKTEATSRDMQIASEAGPSSFYLHQSSGASPPLVSNSPDANDTAGTATTSIGPLVPTRHYRFPAFVPNTIPATKPTPRAVKNESILSHSRTSEVPKLTRRNEPVQYLPRNNAEMISYFLGHLKAIQESDSSRPSSPENYLSPTLSPCTPHDHDLTSSNEDILLTVELGDITKHMKKRQNETGVKEDNAQLPLATSANNQKVSIGVNMLNIDESNTNNEAIIQPEIAQDREIETTQSEYPEEDEFSDAEWTRPEKRRLGVVIRDFSRAIKTKELQQKRTRLIKKGRIIAQAIENKICDIDQEILEVNKKTLKEVALPLDQIQEYDWGKVARVLNAKRTPAECRVFWKCFFHPTINSGDWTPVEIRAMETIAQRHNFRNWDDIAQELNTGRTGFQCFRYFRQNVCPHLELHGQCKDN